MAVAPTPTGIVGSVAPFSPEQESIVAYLERVDLFLLANGIADDKIVPMFLNLLGGKVYSLLRSLVSPTTPSTMTLADLKAVLKTHYQPKKVIIAERYKFHRRNQAEGESIADFVAALRKLAIDCDFGNLNEALRDRFVCGLRSEAIQRKLLTEADLTFASALNTASGMEAAAKRTQQLKSTEGSLHFVHKKPTTVTPARKCYRCGLENHLAPECRHKNAVCSACGKTGHLARVCRSTKVPVAPKPPKRNQRGGRGRGRGTKDVRLLQETDTDEELPLLQVGKRGSHPITVEVKANGKPLLLELDTGAAVSVISEREQKEKFPDAAVRSTHVGLRTYTGESIGVIGEMDIQVVYGSKTHSLSLLVVAGEGPALLGRDWLRHLRLDWKTIGIATLDHGRARLEVLLKQYEDVFQEGLGTMQPFKAKLSVKENAKPVFHKPRPIPFALKEKVAKELDRLEREGIIEKVTHSEWAAPIVPVPKRDGEVRVCGDYKVTVNPKLDIDQYPLPTPSDLFASLARGKRFTKLDLTQAYQQMLLDPDSQQYVTVNTHQGLYRYKRLPFGVASAPAIFQRTMDTILQGIPHVVCYIDDILVTGESEEEHLRNLEEVLKRLRQHGIRIKRSKCAFLQESVEYLGHEVDAKGIHTTTQKVEAIVNAPSPKDVQQLRSFLGMLHYYGKFIPNLATLIHPLNELLHTGTKWKWSKECQEAFVKAKEKLSSADVLAHYDPKLPIRLAGDASAYGMGAVISHVYEDGSERPIAYASRTFTPTERNYAQLEKEAFSIVYGVRKFHTYLYGRRFTICTDHKPLTTILGPKTGIPPLAAARLQRWALTLSAYTYEIQFKRTQDHANADGLSRLPLSSRDKSSDSTEASMFNVSQMEMLPITYSQLKTATRKDPILSRVLRYTKQGWPAHFSPALKPFWTRRTELTLEEDCVMWGMRVIIPQTLRDKVLEELHQCHAGIVRMKAIARSYVWWPKLDEDIADLTKSCLPCQAVKNAPPVAPLHPWTWPTKPWQRIHVDFAGPFYHQSFLIVVDAHSKWPEVIAMKSTTAVATIQELRRLFAAYGLPEQLVSDNGPQFVSSEFVNFLKGNGVKHIRCAPYHPSSNGAAERFVQTFKEV